MENAKLRNMLDEIDQAIDRTIAEKHPAFPHGWITNLQSAYHSVVYRLAMANGACMVRGKDPKTYQG